MVIVCTITSPQYYFSRRFFNALNIRYAHILTKNKQSIPFSCGIEVKLTKKRYERERESH